jgi:hypothetical protein
MMHVGLLKALIERNANYRGMDLGRNLLVSAKGTFLIQRIIESAEGFTFGCVSVVDGTPRTIPGTAIERIDGMCPTRLALNFDLSPEGVPLVVGKRRGRKPKNRLQAPVTAVAG